MASTPLKFGLFTRMLALCILVAGLSAALVTVAFYSYRTAVTTNRLATELSAQSYATAPVVAASLADGNAAGAARLLRVFGGLSYVTCVDIVNDGLLLASWPPLGCDLAAAVGEDSWITVPLGEGRDVTYRIRVDERMLMTPVHQETAIVASVMLLLSLIIFISLTVSFRRFVLTPLYGLQTAMQDSTPRKPVRARHIHDDEIGAIVKAYNSLVAAARLFVRRLDRSQMQLAESEKRFRELAEVSGDWFFEMDADLRLSFVSDSFYDITGLTPDVVIGRQRQDIAVDATRQGAFANHIADLEARREFRRFEYELRGGDDRSVHISLSGVPIFDDEGVFTGYRGVGLDISDIKEKERQLAETNRNFGDSVTYASTIQRGLLPDVGALSEHLGKTRTMWQPKDLVGGDFYWAKRISNIDYLVFFDCTGHGVPGAFMTLIVTSVLDQIAVSVPAPPPAARMLQLVHDGVCRQLGITADSPGHDGLDCAVVRLNRSEDSLEFAGASIDLFSVAASGEVARHRGARVTLGYRRQDAPLALTSQTMQIGDDGFLMSTDGLITQVGETTRRVLGTRRFEEALADAGTNDPARLVRAAGRVLKGWQGREERRDDVSVIAFKPNDFG